ncbi:hypothetical protein, conserved [Eimeria maxima]|uniref:Uncharacterized protein n=1 Tax=Eimeria maxima TaxID=5804 RepID=U6MA37_EIMMA|nr:hypothetical protein, conserved [Eimeria maxima]CDJ59918.1 hypothetical protein, conserved [Eimeria maxima]
MIVLVQQISFAPVPNNIVFLQGYLLYAAATHDGKRSPDHVHQYPRPSPRFVGQLSAVSATMPTAAGTTAAPTATAASADAPHPRRGSAQQRQEQILSSGSAAEAQTTEPHALHGLQSLQRLPHDAHLPPPLASGRYTCEDKFNKTALIEAEVTPKHTPRCLAVSGGLLENEKCSKVISAQEVSAPTTSRRLTAISHAEDGTTAATLPVRSTGTPCGAGASIDPFLAATLLQHLSRTQHNKDPELLSRLLASVSAATANHGQQQRKLLHSEQNSSRLPDSSRVSVTADSASSGLDTSVESAVVVAGAEKEVVTTAANSSEASLGAAASAAFPAELSATEATVRNHRVFHVGTHELRESWATYAAAVVAAADALSPRWGSAKKRSHFGPVAKASRKQNPADHKPGKTRLRINTALSGGISKPAGFTVIPTDQDMIRRLKEQGFHRALMFVTLPWRAFVSQFRKVIDLGTQLPTSAGGNQLPRKSRGTGNSFVPAGAEVARTRTKGEARLAHLYRVWGFSGPPGLSRLRRRHLRRLVMKMSTAVSGTPHPLIEGSMAANVEGLCGKDRERAVGAAPGGRKRNILYGKPFQVASLLSRHSLPPIGVEVAASAVTDASGKGPSPRLTETALPEWQVQHQPAWHPKFPFGISFADTAGTQALLVDTGPLLPPVLPGDAPSSLTKQVKQQYDKKMRCAAQAKAFLQRHQHRRENLTTRIGSPSVGACTATSAEVANPATIPAPGQPSQSPQLSTLQAASVMCPRDSVPSAARRKLGLTAKEEQHRSRLLHAAAGALSAAASMRVLSLRIARPFVVQLPLLCEVTLVVLRHAYNPELRTYDLRIQESSLPDTLATSGSRCGAIRACLNSA